MTNVSTSFSSISGDSFKYSLKDCIGAYLFVLFMHTEMFYRLSPEDVSCSTIVL